MEALPTLRIKDLSAAYRLASGGAQSVLRDVSLDLHAGRITGLAGESGSGKSTLALAVIGYKIPSLIVQGGQCLFSGHDLLSLPINTLRHVWGKDISYIPQGAVAALNPTRRVGDQLAEPLRRHLGLDGARLKARISELLELVELPIRVDALRRYPFEFSGGQQQRMAIAIGLSCNPSVIILDEPTTGQDPITQKKIIETIQRLVHAQNIAALLVSHDLLILDAACDTVSIMYAGQMVEATGARDALAQARHPYTRALWKSLPRILTDDLPVGIPGTPPSQIDTTACAFVSRCAIAQDRCAQEPPDMTRIGTVEVRCHRAMETPPDTPPAEPAPAVGEPSRPDPEPILRVANLSCRYAGPNGAMTTAVQDVSFDLLPGKVLGLIGQSGSGKSTILRAVSGIAPAVGGTIEFMGRRLPLSVRQRPRSVCGEIQLVFQDPETALNPQRTVQQIVSRSLERFRPDIRVEDRKQEILRWLDAVRLPADLIDKIPRQLSGGQRQRVALARAFAAKPRLVLCDEVTSALDVSVQASVLNIIADMSRREGIAFVFVSHDLAVVENIATEIVVLRNGQISERGTAKAVIRDPQTDYTRQLVDAASV